VVARFIANRYEKASTIITSNKAFSDWTELFHDPVIVTAFLDRLLHHSVVINMRGNSYRLRGKVGKEGVEMSHVTSHIKLTRYSYNRLMFCNKG
jgi:DNA replication protein DnaC